MYLLTKRQLIKDILSKWSSSYPVNREITPCKGIIKSTDSIYSQLEALDLDTVEPEVIDNIIGNNSWTTITCKECGENQNTAIVLDDYICKDCLEKALSLFGKD